MELNLIVTNECNMNCTYCYVTHKNRGIMTQAVGENAIDFYASKLTPETSFLINFHGGEPLLAFPLIRHVTDYAKKKVASRVKNLKFSMTTNGTLVTEDIARFLSENSFEINLSIDGKEKTHNLHRMTIAGKGTFDKVMDAACLLKKHNCNYSARMTVTPENVASLLDNVEWLIEVGFEKVSIGVDFFADWSKNFDKLEKAYRGIKNIYLDKHLKQENIYINIFDGKYPAYLVDGKPLFCNAGFSHFAVSPSGKLFPCVYVIGQDEFCFGTLESGIDVKKRDKCMDNFWTKEDNCKKCDTSYFCHGRKCSFLNYRSTGYINVTCENLCKHEKLLNELMAEIVHELYKRKDANLYRMLDIIKNNPSLIPSKAIGKYLEMSEAYGI